MSTPIRIVYKARKPARLAAGKVGANGMVEWGDWEAKAEVPTATLISTDDGWDHTTKPWPGLTPAQVQIFEQAYKVPCWPRIKAVAEALHHHPAATLREIKKVLKNQYGVTMIGEDVKRLKSASPSPTAP